MRLIDADILFEKVGNIKPKNKSEYELLGKFMNMITNSTTVEQRPHGEWISKPKRIQVDETDEERIFETRQEWFCSSCGKSFGLRKPEDAFCKYCGSDNRPKEGE